MEPSSAPLRPRAHATIRRLAALVAATVVGLAPIGCSTSDDASSSPARSTTTSPAPATTTGDAGTTPTTSEAGPAPTDPATQPSAGETTRDQAVQIAVGKYGGSVVDVEADSHHGTPTWEVELTNTSIGRIEVHVSRATGEILKVDDENR